MEIKGDLLRFNFKEKAISGYAAGSGPVLTFIHGFCESSNIWQPVWDELISHNFTVFAMDLPGFGRSEMIASYTMTELAEMVKVSLEKFFPGQKTTLFGHSMGGYINLAFGKQFPELVNGIGLINSSIFGDSEEKKANRQKSISFIERNGLNPFVKQLFTDLFAPPFRNRHEEDIKKLIETGKAIQGAAIVAAQQAMMTREDSRSWLSTADIPVLVVIGKQDPIISYQTSLEQTLVSSVSEVVVFEDSGHMSLFEKPEATANAILAFAKSVTH